METKQKDWLKAEWLKNRRKGIGGSDAAAILGYSPWKKPMDVWLDKKGMVPERTDPDKEFLLDLGQEMEPVIARLYEKQTGRRIEPVGGLLHHPEHPVLLGTPDRLVVGEERGVELKTENVFSDQFGDPGTDEVPINYLIQCAHYMAITGYARWDIAVLHGGARFAIYHLERDLELENMMVAQLLDWWRLHILNNVPPEIDHSEAWRFYLHKKHPVNLLPLEPLPEQHTPLLAQLYRVREAEKGIGVMRDELEMQLKALIADREGYTSPFGRVTWKNTKNTQHTDYQAAFFKLAGAVGATQETQKKILEQFTENRPGVRRFLFTPRKDFHGLPTSYLETVRASVAALAQPGDGERSPGGTSESTD